MYQLVLRDGRYAPFTLQGTVVVLGQKAGSASGIVISDQADWFAEGYIHPRHIPALYHGLLAPVRILYLLDASWVGRFYTAAASAASLAGGASMGESARDKSIDACEMARRISELRLSHHV